MTVMPMRLGRDADPDSSRDDRDGRRPQHGLSPSALLWLVGALPEDAQQRPLGALGLEASEAPGSRAGRSRTGGFVSSSRPRSPEDHSPLRHCTGHGGYRSPPRKYRGAPPRARSGSPSAGTGHLKDVFACPKRGALQGGEKEGSEEEAPTGRSASSGRERVRNWKSAGESEGETETAAARALAEVWAEVLTSAENAGKHWKTSPKAGPKTPLPALGRGPKVTSTPTRRRRSPGKRSSTKSSLGANATDHQTAMKFGILQLHQCKEIWAQLADERRQQHHAREKLLRNMRPMPFTQWCQDKAKVSQTPAVAPQPAAAETSSSSDMRKAAQLLRLGLGMGDDQAAASRALGGSPRPFGSRLRRGSAFSQMVGQGRPSSGHADDARMSGLFGSKRRSSIRPKMTTAEVLAKISAGVLGTS